MSRLRRRSPWPSAFERTSPLHGAPGCPRATTRTDRLHHARMSPVGAPGRIDSRTDAGECKEPDEILKTAGSRNAPRRRSSSLAILRESFRSLSPVKPCSARTSAAGRVARSRGRSSSRLGGFHGCDPHDERVLELLGVLLERERLGRDLADDNQPHFVAEPGCPHELDVIGGRSIELAASRRSGARSSQPGSRRASGLRAGTTRARR